MNFFLIEISLEERECLTGFLVVRGECIDFDECKKHNGFCHENVHCMNTIGSYIVVVAVDIELLQRLTGIYWWKFLSVSILTSVEIEVSVRKSLPVKIVLEATSVSVIKVSKVIFAKTLMSVTKQVLVMQMQHVRTL